MTFENISLHPTEWRWDSNVMFDPLVCPHQIIDGKFDHNCVAMIGFTARNICRYFPRSSNRYSEISLSNAWKSLGLTDLLK